MYVCGVMDTEIQAQFTGRVSSAENGRFKDINYDIRRIKHPYNNDIVAVKVYKTIRDGFENMYLVLGKIIDELCGRVRYEEYTEQYAVSIENELIRSGAFE